MTRYIIDSYAWIEYLLSTDKGFKVKEVLDSSDNRIFTHVLTVSEISSRLSHAGINYSGHIESILSASEVLNIDADISARAGKLHSDIRKDVKDFGLVDAFILLAAKDNGAKIITGDPHFKHIKEAFMI